MEVTRGGSSPGTYACKELAYYYALWVDPLLYLDFLHHSENLLREDFLVSLPTEAFELPKERIEEVINLLSTLSNEFIEILPR